MAEGALHIPEKFKYQEIEFDLTENAVKKEIFQARVQRLPPAKELMQFWIEIIDMKSFEMKTKLQLKWVLNGYDVDRLNAGNTNRNM